MSKINETRPRGEIYTRQAARGSLEKRTPLLLISGVSAVVLLLVVLIGWRISAQSGTSMSNLQRTVVIVKTFDRNGKRLGQGSAIIVSKDLVITNVHVIDGAASATIEFPNGESRDAQGISAEDIEHDLATLSVVTEIAPVALGDSDELEVGSQVIAVGNPLGLQGTVSTGIISGFRENRTLIQTTAPISPGSSGGALFDSKGRLIGVTVAQLKGGQNLNLAVPINLAKPLLMREHGGLSPFAGKHRMPSQLTDIARDGLVGPVRRVINRESSVLGFRVNDAITYNSAGFRTETVDYLFDKIQFTDTYDYDSNGRPIRVHRSFSDGKVHESVYEYDAVGQVVRTMTYRGHVLLSEQTHIYDINGRLVQTNLGDDWGVATYTYDDAGLPLEEVNYLPNGHHMIEAYSDYVLDSFGNWIQRTESLSIFINGQPTSDVPTRTTEFRMLTYGN